MKIIELIKTYNDEEMARFIANIMLEAYTTNIMLIPTEYAMEEYFNEKSQDLKGWLNTEAK